MKRLIHSLRPRRVLCGLGVVLGLAILVPAAEARRGHGGHHGGHGGHHGGHHGHGHRGHRGFSHHGHRGHHGHFGRRGHGFGHRHHRGYGLSFGYRGYGYGGRGYYRRPYSYYRPYSYGYRYYGGYRPYSGYGGSYGYAPRSYGYGGGYSTGYPPTQQYGSPPSGQYGDEGGYSPSAGDGYSAVGGGWTPLSQGQPALALQEFARQAESNPQSGGPKVGYALAAAATGDLSRGVWAMRRACRIDPESMYQLTVGESVRPVIDRSIEAYEADLGRNEQNVDTLFMLASLQYLADDMPAARRAVDSAIELGDRSQSTMNLKQVIDQKQPVPGTPNVPDNGADDDGGDLDSDPPLPPMPDRDGTKAEPLPPGDVTAPDQTGPTA